MGKTRWTFRAILGAILLSIIGTAVWDWAAKPGLTFIGRTVLVLATLGSASVRDDIYRAAAHDPTPDAALFLLFTVLLIGGMAFLAFVVETYGLAKSLLDPNRPPPPPRSLQRLKRDIWIFKIGGVFSVYAVLHLLFTAAKIGIATDIRKEFLANYAIVRPAMTPEEERQIMARFNAVRNHADFEAADTKMRDIARRGGFTSSLWPEK